MPYFYDFDLEQSEGYALDYPQIVEDLQEKAIFKSLYDKLPDKVREYCPWDGESPLSETRFAVLDAQGHVVSLMPELVQLELEKNNLTGNVPASYAGFPHLLELRLRGNRLSGVIPQEIVDSPYFDDWRMERQQEGYGLTLPPTEGSGDSAEAVYGPATQSVRHSKVERPAGELKSEYLRGIAVECGGEKFL